MARYTFKQLDKSEDLVACQKGKALFFARGNHIALRVEASPMEHALATTDPAELVESRVPAYNVITSV
jgi:hypothetical protein